MHWFWSHKSLRIWRVLLRTLSLILLLHVSGFNYCFVFIVHFFLYLFSCGVTYTVLYFFVVYIIIRKKKKKLWSIFKKKFIYEYFELWSDWYHRISTLTREKVTMSQWEILEICWSYCSVVWLLLLNNCFSFCIM